MTWAEKARASEPPDVETAERQHLRRVAREALAELDYIDGRRRHLLKTACTRYDQGTMTADDALRAIASLAELQRLEKELGK